MQNEPQPSPPLTLERLNGRVFLELPWKGTCATLVSGVSGERAVLPPLKAGEQWNLVQNEVMKPQSLNFVFG